jgi:hypothetical protein
MRRIFTAAAIAITGVGLLAFDASPTEAAVFAVGPVTGSVAANTCMDVAANNPAAGTPVIAFPCHAGPNQQFQFDGTSIYTMAAQLCLGAEPAGTPASGQPLALLFSEVCNGSVGQQFSYQNGQIVSALTIPPSTPLCLVGVAGSQLTLEPCGGSDEADEQWEIK